MVFYRRHLPHWLPEGASLFVTWRLHGSLPAHLRTPRREETDAGRAFLAFDRHLDRAATGPLWLKNPIIAGGVVEALHFGDQHLNLYRLLAYTIMANHVHILIRPLVSLPRITKTVKGYTARQANKLLGQTGRPFWQEESYDHWVRNDLEAQRIIRYIERNPVSAGLVEKAEDWPWSSAAK
jgi:REP element-mobilizing transposase RayT